ncbi:hypothetical protein PENSTE_c016G08457 [Penicillium steckii]|uniref:Uncharacterized protein n=1 Tax=Penicillium steckii TaxID=303698 RepID=A0A1V6SZL7_9EURO|nr:hypothetical protein PENSTE_c016G08457 [Penicillium steckii]
MAATNTSNNVAITIQTLTIFVHREEEILLIQGVISAAITKSPISPTISDAMAPVWDSLEMTPGHPIASRVLSHANI